jgi:hypothetical protein
MEQYFSISPAGTALGTAHAHYPIRPRSADPGTSRPFTRPNEHRSVNGPSPTSPPQISAKMQQFDVPRGRFHRRSRGGPDLGGFTDAPQIKVFICEAEIPAAAAREKCVRSFRLGRQIQGIGCGGSWADSD